MRAVLLWSALAAVALPTTLAEDRPEYRAVCYYSSWAVYRPGQGKFDVEDIDPFLCTHHIYAFAGLDASTNSIMSLDPWNDLYDNYGKGAFTRFTNMKQRNPALKTMLAIGGWNEGSSKYSEMAADPSSRATFVASVPPFLEKFNFDGLDLDWEFPAARGGDPIDKTDYLALVKELKAAMAPKGLILSAAFASGKQTIDDSYKLKELGEALDIVNVMTYDYHGSWQPFTGHLAPLYLSPLDAEHPGAEYLSVNYTVNYYITGGVPKEKINMGIPLYGCGFTLDNVDEHGLYAPGNQPQPACPYTRQAGVCGFNEICVMLQEGGWTSVRDADQKAVCSYKDRVWVGYDDIATMKVKTDYIKSMKLGGSMVWSIDTDDFHNLCGFGTANPLMNAIWANLNGDVPVPTGPTPAPGSMRRRQTSTPTPSRPTVAPSHMCKKNGPNPDPDKVCSSIFYECVQGGDHWDVIQECATGTVFDRQANTCTWINESPECNQTTPAAEI